MNGKPPARGRKSSPAKQRPSPAKTWRKKAPADNPSHTSSSTKKVAAYRERMRSRGMKLLQIWVPDTHTPEFIAQAHRESVLIANSATEADDQAFIDSISWWNSEEAAALAEAEGPEPWWRTKETSD